MGSDLRTLDEIDHHALRLTGAVGGLDGLAVPRLHLLQQRDRVVIVDEAHHFAGQERIERAENCRMPKTLGDAACVEALNAFRVGVVMNRDVGHDELLD